MCQSQGDGKISRRRDHTRVLLNQRLHVRLELRFDMHCPLLISTSVNYPDDKMSTLESNEHIHVEQDGEVKTQ